MRKRLPTAASFFAVAPAFAQNTKPLIPIDNARYQGNLGAWHGRTGTYFTQKVKRLFLLLTNIRIEKACSHLRFHASAIKTSFFPFAFMAPFLHQIFNKQKNCL